MPQLDFDMQSSDELTPRHVRKASEYAIEALAALDTVCNVEVDPLFEAYRTISVCKLVQEHMTKEGDWKHTVSTAVRLTLEDFPIGGTL